MPSRPTSPGASRRTPGRLAPLASLLLVTLAPAAGSSCGGGGGATAPAVAVVAPASGSTHTAVRVEVRGETQAPCASCRFAVEVRDDSAGGEVVLSRSDLSEPRVVVDEHLLEWDRSYSVRMASAPPRSGTLTPTQWSEWSPFRIAPLDARIPPLHVTVPATDRVEPGLTLFGLSTLTTGFALAIDRDGAVIWYFERPELGWGDLEKVAPGVVLGTTGYYHSAREQTLDGEVLWESDGPPDALVHHEVLKLPDGHYMYLAEVNRWVWVPTPEGPTVLELWLFDEVREVDEHNEVVWTWNVLDHLGTGTEVYSRNKGSGIRDFSHCNAIDFDEASGDHDTFLLSCRALSRVLKIDRTSGEVLWGFGGDGGLTGTFPFDLGGDAEIYFQHAPHWTDRGTIMVYDNGNSRPGVAPEDWYTRTVEVAIDEQARTADVVWEYRHPTFSDATGDSDLLPGGTVLITNLDGPIEEISRFPNRVEWRVEWNDPLWFAYNAQRIPGLY